MKSLFTTFFLFLFCSEISHAQFAVGVNTGVNLSHLHSNFGPEYYDRLLVNPFIGVSPQYSFGKRFSLSLNIQYSLKGVTLDDGAKFRFTYFDIISEVDYKLNDYLQIGAGVNFAKLHDEANYTNDRGWRSVKFLGNTNTTDYGVTMKIQGNFGDLNAFVRYNHGLGDMTDVVFLPPTAGPTFEVNHYNRNIQIGIGYRIRSINANGTEE